VPDRLDEEELADWRAGRDVAINSHPDGRGVRLAVADG
jgi:hypothetical protein